MILNIQKTLIPSILLCLFCNNSALMAQSETRSIPHPKFSQFTGTVYDMPKINGKGNRKGKVFNIAGLQEYYSDTIYSYPKLGDITLDKINIPESYTNKDKFPGVEKTIKFAMILNSKMEILLDGCYEFSLTSDDGSILWIDGKEIIDNDGGHQMSMKMDSIAYKKGTYDVKLWYFQGMPDRFGLILDAKIAGKLEVCPDINLPSKEEPKKVITLNHIYFETDKYHIPEKGLKELELAVIEIKKAMPSKIQIVGHTDDVGSEDYNQELSLRRAQSIKAELEQLLNDESIELTAIGLGSSAPIASNKSPEGQKLNRRVELVLR